MKRETGNGRLQGGVPRQVAAAYRRHCRIGRIGYTAALARARRLRSAVAQYRRAPLSADDSGSLGRYVASLPEPVREVVLMVSRAERRMLDTHDGLRAFVAATLGLSAVMRSERCPAWLEVLVDHLANCAVIIRNVRHHRHNRGRHRFPATLGLLARRVAACGWGRAGLRAWQRERWSEVLSAALVRWHARQCAARRWHSIGGTFFLRIAFSDVGRVACDGRMVGTVHVLLRPSWPERVVAAGLLEVDGEVVLDAVPRGRSGPVRYYDAVVVELADARHAVDMRLSSRACVIAHDGRLGVVAASLAEAKARLAERRRHAAGALLGAE